MASLDSLDEIRQLTEQREFSHAAAKCLTLLKQEPKNIEANALYGNLAVKMHRLEDAILIYRKLLALDPRHRDAHDELAYLYHLTGDYVVARKHAMAALQIDPDLVGPRLILGTIAIADGHNEEALQLFEEARKLAPGLLYTEKAYLDALFVIGDFDAVQDLSLELITRYPNESYLYITLARSHKFFKDDPVLPTVLSLLNAEGELTLDDPQPDDCIRAYMALFKVQSDLNNTPVAFSYLNKAKELRKAQFPYHLEHVITTQKQIREVFTADFFKSRTSIGCVATDPIFIVGMPRSGTTLLERILSSHDEVAAGGELPAIGRLREQACARFGTNQYDLSALEKVPEEIWTKLGEEYVRLARLRVPNSVYFTDKMPGNAFSLGFIKAMLPQARIIHLSRHPVATCLSIYEQDFAALTPFANDLGWLGTHYVQYRKSMDYWRELFGDDIIELDYESLVSDTNATVTWLGQQLGLDFNEDDIRTSQKTGTITTASLWQARQPIHSDSVARWQKLEEELGPLFDALAPVWTRGSEQQGDLGDS